MRSLLVASLALLFVTSTASASKLDYQPGPLAAGPAQFKDFAGTQSNLENNGPIRRRRPYRDRDRYYDRRERESTLFAMLGAGTFDPSNQPGNGLYVNGGIGSTLAEQIDIGVQVSWYHEGTDGETFIREYDLPNGTHVRQVVNTQSIDTDLVPVLGTIRVRIPVSPQLQPYVGGGVGWEWLTVEGTDSSGAPFSNDYDGFGAQLFAGLNLNVAPTTGLYGEAVWNASTPKAEFFDPSIGEVVREEVDFDGFAIHGGLRFGF